MMEFKPSKKTPNKGKLILETKEEIMFIKEVLGTMSRRKNVAAGIVDEQEFSTYGAMSKYLDEERPLYRVSVALTSTAELVEE